LLDHAKVIDPDGRGGVSVLRGGVVISRRDAGIVCQLTVGARVCRSGIHAQVTQVSSLGT
jgi:hypothetical protein